jgi:ATP-dependent Lhr-like helicase
MTQRRSRSESTGLELFHPLVKEWFLQNLGPPTNAQREVWPAIARGENALLLAPTGSGKTLAAFLVAIDRLAFGKSVADPQPSSPSAESGVSLPASPTTSRRSRKRTSPNQLEANSRRSVRVLYISPLKALGADIARNLQLPLAGLSELAAAQGLAFQMPTVGIRSGDTPASERHRLTRTPPDILITTPESLYLLLTSRAREMLTGVETVIVDEIHSLVANKRGAHLFLSLERLESLRRKQNPAASPLQRIGLSATQRPLDEVATLLGGAESDPTQPEILVPRPVTIVAAGRRKELEISIEMPLAPTRDSTTEESSRTDDAITREDATQGKSIWPAIHPRLVELIRSHHSTMLFVNNRRLAERLAAAINELAGEEIALAHHGSIAKETRRTIEERLKEGTLPAIVATSSLELGIDMGAVELVIQIESPPSIAAGLQRIGRAGHQVGAASKGIVFPKFRGDLLACAAASARMMAGEVEETRFPRNPLDVLAQQIVAMVATSPVTIDELFATVRRAAPYHELPWNSFIGVLDLLSGRYPSEEFSELRPRVNWDRATGLVTARRDALRVAVANAGTIPDRGLYGVFLADGERGATRVGELDEEMVFETAIGDVFLLGASSWRVLDITTDRVLVSPAPGEPGRMPFWRGDGPGRPLEFGRAIGQLTRRLAFEPERQMIQVLTSEHGLQSLAAEQLVDYVRRQAAATVEPPSDATIVVESFRDEVGDWRVVVLTPFGSRVHAPWATVALARIRQEWGGDPDVVWDDDGFALRISAADSPPPVAWLIPLADEVEASLVRELAGTSLFAGRFRENAARALLLPRRFPGRRTPLWLQRRRSADLLHVAARFPDFPILLETYRECLRDVFDLPGLKAVLSQLERVEIRVRPVETRGPSPFASTLLFGYAGNFLYNSDTPLAERRAHALALDHSQLRELLGEAELRELLDQVSVQRHERELQRLDGRFPPRDVDDLRDLLARLGDLSVEEIAARMIRTNGDSNSTERTTAVNSTEFAQEHPQFPDLQDWLRQLQESQRALPLTIAGETRWIAIDDAARYRDALGVALPANLPAVFLERASDAWVELISRYARTHGPFVVESPARRWGVGFATILGALQTLALEDEWLRESFYLKAAVRNGVTWSHCELYVASRSLPLVARSSLSTTRDTRDS